MDQQIRGGEPESIRQQITELALQHQLVTKYTSLVAVDPQPVRSPQDALKKRLIASNLPAGSQQNIQGYGFPQGATASRLHLLLGFVAMIMAALLIGFRQRYEQ